MTGAAFAVVPDPRSGARAFDAYVLTNGKVLDKRRFTDRTLALRWARERVFELFPELLTLQEQIERAGYKVRVEPAPRDGEAGWYAFAEVEGRVVGLGYGETEDEALFHLAGELGLEVRR